MISEKDVMGEQFFLEHFKRDPFGRVEYARLMSLWQSYTNDKKSSTREVINKLIMRFPWLEKKKANTVCYLVGLTEGEFPEFNDPKGKPGLDNQENINSNSQESTSSTESTENGIFTLTMGNRENPYVKLESSTFGTFGTASAKSEALELDDPEGEQEPGETLLSLASELYEVHRENLRKSNLPITNAHVSLDDLKEYAKLRGITGEVFQKAYLALLDSKRIIYDEPYIRIHYEHN